MNPFLNLTSSKLIIENNNDNLMSQDISGELRNEVIVIGSSTTDLNCTAFVAEETASSHRTEISTVPQPS